MFLDMRRKSTNYQSYINDSVSGTRSLLSGGNRRMNSIKFSNLFIAA